MIRLLAEGTPDQRRGAHHAPSTSTVAATHRRTEPPKPGLVRVADASAGAGAGAGTGAAIDLEVWALPPVGFADFVASLPQPMAVGTVDLADGTSVAGFLCEPAGLEGARDITSYGGWRSYLAGG